MGLLDEKIAVITGGSRGIGRAICEAYIREDAKVVIAATNLETAKKTAEEIGAIAVHLDVSDKNLVPEVIDFIWENVGPIDIWVNNAGISDLRPFEYIDEAAFDKTIDVNLKGVFLCSQAVYARMKENGGGKIINISSVAGERGGKWAGLDYSAAKGGVNTFTKALARIGGEFGVTVNAITPGLILTQMAADDGFAYKESYDDIPLGRLGAPEDVANAAVFLGSYLSDYITGDILRVNGGMYM